MLGRINSQAEKNKVDLLQNIQNVVEMNNFTAEKKKMDLLLSIQNIVERMNSQLERNKEDLLQNIQNVVERMNSQLERNKEDLLQNIQNVASGVDELRTRKEQCRPPSAHPECWLWASGEPNNEVDREDCGEKIGELNDLPSDVKQSWICEKSLV
ncbi:hypothetical protein GJAV_G00264810 [Gymnothorax javanicus]|nr:hypothetical protein GJAV_G00264810 [Gymnothorax javanicus]